MRVPCISEVDIQGGDVVGVFIDQGQIAWVLNEGQVSEEEICLPPSVASSRSGSLSPHHRLFLPLRGEHPNGLGSVETRGGSGGRDSSRHLHTGVTST